MARSVVSTSREWEKVKESVRKFTEMSILDYRVGTNNRTPHYLRVFAFNVVFGPPTLTTTMAASTNAFTGYRL